MAPTRTAAASATLALTQTPTPTAPVTGTGHDGNGWQLAVIIFGVAALAAGAAGFVLTRVHW